MTNPVVLIVLGKGGGAIVGKDDEAATAVDARYRVAEEIRLLSHRGHFMERAINACFAQPQVDAFLRSSPVIAMDQASELVIGKRQPLTTVIAPEGALRLEYLSMQRTEFGKGGAGDFEPPQDCRRLV